MAVKSRNLSNRHLHKAQVPLQPLCQRLFNSHSSQHQLQGNTSPEMQMPQARSFNLLSRAKWHQRTKQQTKGKQTFFLAVDDKQAGPSRPLTFTLTPTKHFNPRSVASVTGKESHLNISGVHQKPSICDELPADIFTC